jgi:hypothetical protein
MTLGQIMQAAAAFAVVQAAFNWLLDNYPTARPDRNESGFPRHAGGASLRH